MGSSTKFKPKEKEIICLECRVKCSNYIPNKNFPFSSKKSHKRNVLYKTNLSELYQFCQHYKLSTYRTL